MEWGEGYFSRTPRTTTFSPARDHRSAERTTSDEQVCQVSVELIKVGRHGIIPG
jgi:hypothetical protein